MIDLLEMHKQFLGPHIKEGGAAADFTMGNGHDTLWLSRGVGENGRVYAFDIQEAALNSTRRLLEESDAPRNYTLIHDSHANAALYIKEPICVGMFNLGYLPGGDKSITTMRESTLAAVDSAIGLLEHGGGLCIAVYPGHAEGTAEGIMLDDHLRDLSKYQFCVSRFQIINSPLSPFFFLVEKK